MGVTHQVGRLGHYTALLRFICTLRKKNSSTVSKTCSYLICRLDYGTVWDFDAPRPCECVSGLCAYSTLTLTHLFTSGLDEVLTENGVVSELDCKYGNMAAVVVVVVAGQVEKEKEK